MDLLATASQGLEQRKLSMKTTELPNPALRLRAPFEDENGLSIAGEYFSAAQLSDAVAAERERCVSVLDSLPTPASYKAQQHEEFLAWTATARRRILEA